MYDGVDNPLFYLFSALFFHSFYKSTWIISLPIRQRHIQILNHHVVACMNWAYKDVRAPVSPHLKICFC